MKNTEGTPAHHKTDSPSSKDIWDMNLDSPLKKLKTMASMAQPLYRERRLSEVMLEYFAHAAPLLAHTTGAVVAFSCAQQK